MPLNSGQISTGKFGGLALKAWSQFIGQTYPTNPILVKNNNIATHTCSAASTHVITFTAAMVTANYHVNVESTAFNNIHAAITAKTTAGFTATLSSNGAAHEFLSNSVVFEVFE